jgi:hypothetical protein
MEKKKTYTKTILLTKYKPIPAPAQCDKAALQKLGIYSEPSLEPISIKMPSFATEMLYTQKPRASTSPRHPKAAPAEESKEKVVAEKLPVFSFVASYLKVDPKAEVWYYSDECEHNIPYRGPFSSKGWTSCGARKSFP